MAPLVSIIIPCYNAARWLPATLDSALAQSWPNREVIVVDDGSHDDSLAVANSYNSRGVRVIAQTNHGAAAARNRGLSVAKGTFVQFLDADDLLSPEKIARQINLLEAAGDDVLVGGRWGRFLERPEQALFHDEAVYAATTGVEFLQLHYETGSMMQPGGWLAPRQLLDRAGPWNETLSLNDDGEYFARVMLAARRLVFVSEARAYYRSCGDSSLSHRTDSTALESLSKSVDLTTSHLLAADSSSRTQSACAHAWKLLALETCRALPAKSVEAEARCLALGGSRRPLPGGRCFQVASRLMGWRLACHMIRR